MVSGWTQMDGSPTCLPAFISIGQYRGVWRKWRANRKTYKESETIDTCYTPLPPILPLSLFFLLPLLPIPSSSLIHSSFPSFPSPPFFLTPIPSPSFLPSSSYFHVLFSSPPPHYFRNQRMCGRTDEQIFYVLCYKCLYLCIVSKKQFGYRIAIYPTQNNKTLLSL